MINFKGVCMQHLSKQSRIWHRWALQSTTDLYPDAQHEMCVRLDRSQNPLGQSEPARLFLLAGLLTVWEVTREHNVGSDGEFIHSASQRQSPMTVNGSSARTPSAIQTKTLNSRLTTAYMTKCRRKTPCCESFPNGVWQA